MRKQYVRVLLFLHLLCLSITGFSQIILKEFNIGLFVGTSQYNGDVNMTRPYYSPHLTGGIWAKQVFNHFYTLRYAISYAELKGDDRDFNNMYQQLRGHHFSDNNIYEFAAMVEFNFFEVTPERDRDNLSPYIVGGLGLFYAEDLEWTEILTIPMGLGIKFRASPRIEFNLEWVFRKTFTDKLDRLGSSGVALKNFKQYSFDNTNDWYSLMGVSVLFSFLNPGSPCNVYYEKPKRIGRSNR